MLPHQSVFFEEHRGNIYIKKINMNHLSQGLIEIFTYLNEWWSCLVLQVRRKQNVNTWSDTDTDLGLLLSAVNYYHKALHLGCCSSPRFATVTDCVRIDSELHVQPFIKGVPVPLPQWFCREIVVCFAQAS